MDLPKTQLNHVIEAWDSETAYLRAEIDALRSDMESRGKSIMALENENERLRAALEGMIEFLREEFNSMGGHYSPDDDPRMKAANLALRKSHD